VEALATYGLRELEMEREMLYGVRMRGVFDKVEWSVEIPDSTRGIWATRSMEVKAAVSVDDDG